MPRACVPGSLHRRGAAGAMVPLAQSGKAIRWRTIRPAAVPPLPTNQWARVIRASASLPCSTATPCARPSARRIRPPVSPRSIRKSPASLRSWQAAPASMTKPILPGISGNSFSRACISLAMRWVSSPACQSGVTRRFCRPSRAGWPSTRSSVISRSISAGQPRLGYTAQLQVGAAGEVDQAVAVRQRRFAQSQRLPCRHPTEPGFDPDEQAVPRRHRSPGIGAPTLDHEAAHAASPGGKPARIELRRVRHKPAACSAANRASIAARAPGLASAMKARTSGRPSVASW